MWGGLSEGLRGILTFVPSLIMFTSCLSKTEESCDRESQGVNFNGNFRDRIITRAFQIHVLDVTDVNT